MLQLLGRTALATPIVALVLAPMLLTAQQPPPPPGPVGVTDAPVGVQELTRGPIHEAFGRPVLFNPHPGPLASKEPPPPIDEIPPGERPAGDNVAWIPGYWAWDNEQNQFIWVSGFWRELPPGRTWVPGYWNRTDAGPQWVSGYWAPTSGANAATDVEYLPEPPASLETGAPAAAPNADQMWIPGLWIWQSNQYAWRPGYWTTGYADWVWTPADYQWSPLGYIYVPGFWDYPLWRRGLLFAPVTFGPGYPLGQPYTPRLALNTAYLGYSLFAHPQTDSYYFGDYYANNYLQAGYYPWFSFHNTRFGYDPLFAHADWVYAKQNIDWEARLRQVYYQRRDDPTTRPGRLYRDYVRGTAGRGDAALVRPLAELGKAADLPFKMERVDAARIREVAQHARAVRDFGSERAKLEGQRFREAGVGAATAARGRVTVHLPEPPRFVGAAAARPPSPRVIPEHPTLPAADLSRKPEPRPAQAEIARPQPQPKIEERPIPVRTPGVLPHPEEVLHPEFNRRPGIPIAPQVRPVQPPPVHFNPPPITGMPHPGHVALPPGRR